jgi:hypothetical protein
MLRRSHPSTGRWEKSPSPPAAKGIWWWAVATPSGSTELYKRKADLIHIANLRILRGTGEMLAEKITAAVRKRRPAVIILQILDNTVFEALTEDGDKIPPTDKATRFIWMAT